MQQNNLKGRLLVFKCYLISAAIFLIFLFVLKKAININLNEEQIKEFLKTAITMTSIMFGFFGTMLGHIINLKSKYEDNKNNIITKFFEKVNPNEIKWTLSLNVVNTILVDSVALFILGFNFNHYHKVVYAWVYLLISYVIHQLYVYNIFISLLIYQKKETKIKGKLTDKDEEEFNNKFKKT